jgi:hypothetical protein
MDTAWSYYQTALGPLLMVVGDFATPQGMGCPSEGDHAS